MRAIKVKESVTETVIDVMPYVPHPAFLLLSVAVLGVLAAALAGQLVFRQETPIGPQEMKKIPEEKPPTLSMACRYTPPPCSLKILCSLKMLSGNMSTKICLGNYFSLLSPTM